MVKVSIIGATGVIGKTVAFTLAREVTVDEIVMFDSLTDNELKQIVDLMLNDTQNVLDDKNIKMFVSDEAKQFILEKGTDIKYGARPLRRTIEKYIEDELSDMILKGTLKIGQSVYIDLVDGKLSFKAKK